MHLNRVPIINTAFEGSTCWKRVLIEWRAHWLNQIITADCPALRWNDTVQNINKAIKMHILLKKIKHNTSENMLPISIDSDICGILVSWILKTNIRYNFLTYKSSVTRSCFPSNIVAATFQQVIRKSTQLTTVLLEVIKCSVPTRVSKVCGFI